MKYYFNLFVWGAWWLSDKNALLGIEGLGVWASLEALHCVLEQDTLSSA